MTLLATLIMMTVLASFAALLQQRAIGQIAVVTDVIGAFERERAHASLLAHLRPSVAESLLASAERQEAWLPLNRDAIELRYAGQTWRVTAQDVNAVPSLVTSPPHVFEGLFLFEASIGSDLIELRAPKPPQAAVWDTQAFLRDASLNTPAWRQVTARPTDGPLNVRHVPGEFQVLANELPRSVLTDRPAETILIEAAAEGD